MTALRANEFWAVVDGDGNVHVSDMSKSLHYALCRYERRYITKVRLTVVKQRKKK